MTDVIATPRNARLLTRTECVRCGTEVRAGKRWHFCGDPYPLRKAATVTRTYELVLLDSREDAHVCGRILIGQGGDTWDPTCSLPAGHTGRCRPGMTWRCDCGLVHPVVAAPEPIRCGCGRRVPRDPTIVSN